MLLYFGEIAMRLQLALNVSSLDEAIPFYEKVLGVEVNKREPGYANFVVADPALKLVLFESADNPNKLNHLGVEVFDDADVAAAAERWRANGIEHDDAAEEDQRCRRAPSERACEKWTVACRCLSSQGIRRHR